MPFERPLNTYSAFVVMHKNFTLTILFMMGSGG